MRLDFTENQINLWHIANKFIIPLRLYSLSSLYDSAHLPKVLIID